MIFILDTNVVSEQTKSNPSARVDAFLKSVPAENIRVSSIVVGEVAQGVANDPTPELEKFLADVLCFPMADFGEAEALELNCGASIKQIPISLLHSTLVVR